MSPEIARGSEVRAGTASTDQRFKDAVLEFLRVAPARRLISKLTGGLVGRGGRIWTGRHTLAEYLNMR
jgi:hypothetical protein